MIPVARPSIGEEEVLAVGEVLRSGWLTQGAQVAALEREFSAAVGAPYACAVSNCTTALHLALLAAGVSPRDEVITASHSFIATANCIRFCGAVPVFVDIDAGTYNLDPARIEAALSPRTRAILCVHQMGMPCDLQAILAVGRHHGIAVVEDAACATGSEIRVDQAWQPIGAPHGDVACFSFHPRKVVTCGEGGMLTTRHPEWDRKFRLWRQQGMSVPDTVRHGSSQVIFESYPELGYNYRLTDIQAAVARTQLARLPQLLEERRLLAQRYAALLSRLPSVTPPTEPEWARSNWQSYCVRLARELDQRTVMQRMLEMGVSTRRGIMCAHREPAYRSEPWRSASDLVESEEAQDHAILLPLYNGLSEADQGRVIEAVRQAVTA